MATSLFFLTTTTLFLLLQTHHSTADLIAEPVNPTEPLQPGDSSSSTSTSPNTVPAFPVQTTPSSPICHLDLSDELFGGVNEACSNNLDRSRCCPVLAAWLFAAHAHSALQISPASSPSPSPSPSPSLSPSPSQPLAPSPTPFHSLSSSTFSTQMTDNPTSSDLLPMMPDDSQKCVSSLQDSLLKRNIILAQPNASCDTILCFCGIRLHQITSLKCTAAFNLSAPKRSDGEAVPTAAVKSLEKSCRNSSYSGCTKCLGALHKLKNNGKTKESSSSRERKMFSRDCQLMGLTWLLARNKTEYIPTVSAVLRALLYSSHPHESKCSPDQENMPLAVDSLQFVQSSSKAASWLPGGEGGGGGPFFVVISLLFSLLVILRF